MTTFHFRLQRVLEFRGTQFQVAESECHRAAARLRSIQAQQAALAARKSETRKAFANLPEAEGSDLMPLPDWYQWTEKAGSRLSSLERTAVEELQKHRDALIEARRKVRLLEKLRDKRQAEWQQQFDREIEELAADSTNSRYARRTATLP
jgi:flagellar export protein FliJ